MKTNLRDQLAHLDRSLMALLNERARLIATHNAGQLDAAVEDLLSRSTGPFEANALREVFRWIETGCAGGEGSER